TLHTGSFAGAWGRWLWMLASLIGATLPLTGYYRWWKRNVQRSQITQHHPCESQINNG
ncbi:MAG: PepSY domain-containing protein, partial [Bacteroidaceae bacterium]|nr:PepSY domain-containing protein [Bacteroidaceae bacterium]